VRGHFAVLAVPSLVLGQLLLSFEMKPNKHYFRRSSFALTSSHGMV
jgi:hypothetical protein